MYFSVIVYKFGADKIGILSESTGDAQKMTGKLHRTALKAVLLVSCEKTELLDYKNQKEKFMKSKYGNIKGVGKSKYLENGYS